MVETRKTIEEALTRLVIDTENIGYSMARSLPVGMELSLGDEDCRIQLSVTTERAKYTGTVWKKLELTVNSDGQTHVLRFWVSGHSIMHGYTPADLEGQYDERNEMQIGSLVTKNPDQRRMLGDGVSYIDRPRDSFEWIGEILNFVCARSKCSRSFIWCTGFKSTYFKGGGRWFA